MQRFIQGMHERVDIDRVYAANVARDDTEECREARNRGREGGHEAGKEGRGEDFWGYVKKG